MGFQEEVFPAVELLVEASLSLPAALLPEGPLQSAQIWRRGPEARGGSGGGRRPRAPRRWRRDGPREDKRSYSMEHFRWGKPVGKKRRPVKVYPNGAEDESAQAFPLEFKRELTGERLQQAPGPEAQAESAAARAELEYGLVAEAEAAEKKDEGPYKMEHFRWGSPPKDKRYCGFMTSEKSLTPLSRCSKTPSSRTPTRRASEGAAGRSLSPRKVDPEGLSSALLPPRSPGEDSPRQ
ncbi:pro-opiomelanocortin-like [Cervus canadensis]|uniref:pro-opiomelanocortin-like n=1 Tax=Cervus canadensis TaxID=1574408 RepID=UPI001CA36726|nr:pro-opiomelanocortin-like [Cervus canadensis]